MAKENAILDKKEQLNEDLTESFDFDELEEKLQSQLEEELADMQFLAEEKEKIGNPDNLGNVIMDVVWEQFINQVAVTAGEDFIKENRGLHLYLRKEAHIQTTENFADGKIATHNTEIDYQQRYDDWQSNFVKDENGNVVIHQTRSGKEEATLVKGARKPFDEGRPTGSVENRTDMDHTVSAAEIIRDPAANAHMTKDEQIAFANSDANLNEMDSSLNRSKGDKSMTDWLDNPNSSGQKPDEIFDISAEDEAKLRQKDAEAREEYEKQKKEAEQKSIEAGKKSRKEEAFRIGGKALRAVLMQLLAELVREIVAKMVKWFKSSKKALDTLLDSLKEAIHSFIGKMKQHLINAGNTLFTTVATAIIGPIVGTIKKVWIMLKQGWSSLKNAIAYIKDPANKGKPIGRLMMEVGKIVIAGMTGIGVMVLGEVIEKGLMTIPIFAVEIPLLGSLANILGIFLGAVVAGIIGAIAINIIEKQIEKSMKRDNVDAQIEKGNEILRTQHQLQAVHEVKLDHTKGTTAQNIHDRHVAAANVMADSVENIRKNCATDESIDDAFDDIDKLFDELED
ncbi:cation diffusion facilitator family transporter [Massilimicrobiota sp. An134]|uniref:cation diffusion facilitator family transporter n=1 Tax=Massilimicrobiota sp. An134 TaxID=1965557 RepID=UPI000B3909D1|nr:cation diffusion facilitator family transporter [Massilimicrobiota sp. An134]OUQ25675.1 cation diffusion facilitator family transporter [Massilimicrobiota sp. An134]